MIKTLLLLTSLALVQAHSNIEAVLQNSGLWIPHEDCPVEEVHYLLPHEYDCSLFYYCIYGMKFNASRGCAPGTEFNPELQVCVHASESGCTLPGPGPTDAPPTGPTAGPTTGPTAGPTNGTTNGPTIAPVTEPTEATPRPTLGPINPDDCETFENGCPVDFTIHKLIPHEDYCHLFYYCIQGERVLRSCPERLYFDPKNQTCVWAEETDCVNDGPYTYPPTAAPENVTIPDIGDVLDNGCPADFDIQLLLPHEECEKYYQCNYGQKLERDCQPGTVFNFPKQYCDWPSNVANCSQSAGATARPTPAPGSSEEIPLPNDPDIWEALPNGCPADFAINHLLPHETDCGKYYACANGGLIKMECPPRLHFSPSQQLCTWPTEAGCEHWTDGCTPGDNDNGCTASTLDGDDDSITTTTPVTTTTTGASGNSSEVVPDPEVPGDWEPLPNGCPADFDIHFLLPHEYDCEKFYYCVHGNKVEHSCAPNGTHFSPTLQRCAWPEEAGCEHWDPPATEDTPTDAVPEDTTTTTTSSPADDITPSVSTTTTVDPDCPECPVEPAEICKESCNIAPWAHPECDKFYFCIGDQARIGICAEGLHFNPSTLSCDFICNADCVRNIPQITRHSDGLLMFVPNSFDNRNEVMDRIGRELDEL